MPDDQAAVQLQRVLMVDIVRLIYQWSVVGGPLGFMLSNLPNGYSEMMGISAFRAEPYSP